MPSPPHLAALQTLLLDPNALFPGLVGLWCVVGLAQTAARAHATGQLRAVFDPASAQLMVLVGTVASVVLLPSVAAAIAMGTWTMLILVPNLATRLVVQLLDRRSFGRAELLSRLCAVLRPWSDWPHSTLLIRARHLHADGRPEAALALLSRIEQRSHRFAPEARLERLTSTGDWAGVLAAAEAQLATQRVPLSGLPRILRALGETGRSAELARVLSRHADALLHAPEVLTRSLLVGLAFTGQVSRLRHLLGTSLGSLDETSRNAWLGTAELVAGRVSHGERLLERALATADAAQAESIRRRLAEPPTPSTCPGPDDLRPLDELFARWEQAVRYVPGHGARHPAWATAALTATILVWFAVELWFGDPMNHDTLERMGALVPSRVLAGEWWRLFTALFLHMGPAHLLMNLVALVPLGTFVERRLGRVALLFLFICSGSIPMLGHAIGSWWNLSESHAVGASGGVMGLVGATGAVLARGWFEQGVREAREYLRLLVMLVVAQTALDLAVPMIDFLGHALGLLVGFTLGGLLSGLSRWRIAVVALPGALAVLGSQPLLAHLPWRSPPCSGGETAICEQICRLGELDACTNLAFKYVLGEDVEEDPKRARQLLDLPCQHDIGEACALLGALLYEGTGGPVDTSRGLELSIHACNLGAKLGCDLLRDYCAGGDAEACAAARRK